MAREMTMRKLKFKELLKELKVKKSTLIFCHRNPDPDTLGSAFALSHILEHFGSRVTVRCCDRPNPKFEFIYTISKISDGDFDINAYERVIAIDVGSASQLGEYSSLADKVDITIDHHENSTRFSDYYEDFTPACAMIVYEIARSLKLLKKLPRHFFSSVYAGLSGDTGCFKYSNTTPKALSIASELIQSGIDFADINYKIFDCKSIGEISAIRMAYENVVMLCDSTLAILTVTNEMRARYSVNDDDIGDIINTVRQIQGVLIAITIKQSSRDESKFSISTRANADIDVSRLCAEIGGGGHPRAAGATLTDSDPQSAFEKIKALFERGIDEYNRH